MDRTQLQQLLTQLCEGRLSVAEVLQQLTHWPLCDATVAQLDTQRPLRNGFEEVIYGAGKQLEQLIPIVRTALAQGRNVFATRVAPAMGSALATEFPALHYDPVVRTAVAVQRPIAHQPGRVAIVAAGTSDLPVAEEARHTMAFFGVEAETHYDVGVAGLHRLLQRVPQLREVDIAIIVAGMEGALPTVLAGLIPAVVIAVPTSVGYGTNLAGLTALFGMLNSCAEGLSVVNIDNGYGAACVALRALRKIFPRA